MRMDAESLALLAELGQEMESTDAQLAGVKELALRLLAGCGELSVAEHVALAGLVGAIRPLCQLSGVDGPTLLQLIARAKGETRWHG